MRNRNRGGFTISGSHTQEYKDHNCANTSWALNASYAGQATGVYETMSDVVTPKFRSSQAKGLIFMNPMSKLRSELSVMQGVGYETEAIPPAVYGCAATAVYPKYRMDGNAFPLFVHLMEGLPAPYSAYIPPRLVISPGEISSLVTEVCTKCWASRNLADSNLFESVAEYKQTMKTFGDLFRRTRQTMLSYARAPLVGASSVHLMIRYGLGPLVRDIQSIVKGLEKPRDREIRKTTRASGNLSRSSTRTLTSSYGGMYTQGVSRLDNDEVSVRAMSLDAYKATLAANIGFTDNGLLITPWELVPWSFVADWFVNVGNYIQALAPAQGRKQLGSCYVVKRISSSLWMPTGTTPVGNWNVKRSVSGGMLSTQERTDRYSVLAPPGLVVNTDFKLGLDSIRTLDALALVVQVVNRIASQTRR